MLGKYTAAASAQQFLLRRPTAVQTLSESWNHHRLLWKRYSAVVHVTKYFLKVKPKQIVFRIISIRQTSLYGRGTQITLAHRRSKIGLSKWSIIDARDSVRRVSPLAFYTVDDITLILFRWPQRNHIVQEQHWSRPKSVKEIVTVAS